MNAKQDIGPGLLSGGRSDLPPVILVLSLQRSGTNFMFDMFKGYRQALVLREAFNPVSMFGADARIVSGFAALLGHPLEGPADQRLLGHLRRAPAEGLLQIRALAAAQGKRMVILKVFPGHIAERDLVEDILPDPQVRPLFLVRSPIEAWISLVKARLGASWSATDTTDVKPSVWPGDFAVWQDVTDSWYRMMWRAVLARGGQPLVLDYDRDLCGRQEQVQSRLHADMVRIAPELQGAALLRSDRMRQDRTTEPFERVANGQELKAWLMAEGRLDRALTPPLPPIG